MTKVDKNETDDDNLESIVNNNDTAIKTIVNGLKTKVDGTNLTNHILKTDKPDISNLATKSSLTTIENKIPDVNGFVKKTDYATEITSIKNYYATKAILDSKINDLKNQHISDEVKKVDDNVKKILLIY